MESELKIVILIKGEAASIGVQSPESDPVFVLLKGDLPAVLLKVPEIVETARAKWEENPRYPKCEIQEPAQTPSNDGVTQVVKTTPAPKTTPQPNMF
jgi:hypothetical protein